MKNLKIAAGAMSIAALVAGKAVAETADFQASATILNAIAVTKIADLNFASIVPSATSASTVVVDSAGSLTCGAGLTCLGTPSAADFTVAGTPDETYSLSLPADANITSGANTMLVESFTTDLAGNSGTLTGGASAFKVGATLNVGAAQATGNYAGTFTVTVNYN